MSAEERRKWGRTKGFWVDLSSICRVIKRECSHLLSSKALRFPGTVRVSDADSFSWNAGMSKGNPRGTIYWQGKKNKYCVGWEYTGNAWLTQTPVHKRSEMLHHGETAWTKCTELSLVCSFPRVKQFEIRNALWPWTLTDRTLSEQLNLQWHLSKDVCRVCLWRGMNVPDGPAWSQSDASRFWALTGSFDPENV